jgi:predicted ABC-type ATPase
MAQPNERRPRVVVVAGPNGAGKSSAAASILPALGVTDFVNADVIARTLGVQSRARSAASRARDA